MNVRIAKLCSTLLLLICSIAYADVDHSLLDGVLKAHVRDGQVDYPALANDKSFANYLAMLKSAQVPAAKSEKLAFYMNAYNAFAMQGVLDGRSPSNAFSRIRFFKIATYALAGEEINLHSIEHEILRKMGEPRIHFSIVCVSSSCPKIRSDAYTAPKLEEQLEDNTRRFINDTTRNRFDKPAKVANLSQIFNWFESDFSSSAGSVQKYVAKYVNDPDIAKDLANDGYKIKHLEYNWGLNGILPTK